MKTINRDTQQLTEHFFRHSYGKIVAVLVRYFGLQEVALAEDIVQDTLIEAMTRWGHGTLPDNPEAWLMEVAKRKLITVLKRKQLYREKILPGIQSKDAKTAEFVFDQQLIEDSTLRMIFSCCHPEIPRHAQIALVLKSLCGLNVAEVAEALLTNEASIHKRLYRAKQQFRNGNITFEIPQEHLLAERLDTVFVCLYLLFNEGYYARHHESPIRADLCFEAIRLQKLVVAAFPLNKKAKALLALMLLSFARFQSRQDNDGVLVIFEDQDRSKWDKEIIAEGMMHLTKSIEAVTVSAYHLLAGIAAEHCMATNFEATNWKSIYNQYTLLEKLEPSILVKLNKAIARYFCQEKTEAIKDLIFLKQEPGFKETTLYCWTLAKLHENLGDKDIALGFYKSALAISNSERERKAISLKIKN